MNRGSPSVRIGIASLLVSLGLFILGVVLAEILQYPGVAFSTFAVLASFWLMVFGIALLVSHSRPLRWSFLGSGLLSSGVLAFLLAYWFYMDLETDEGPRCYGGCTSLLLRLYQEEHIAIIPLALFGIVALGLGVFFAKRVKLEILSPKTDSTTTL